MLILSQEHPYNDLTQQYRNRIQKYLSWASANVPVYCTKKSSWNVCDGLLGFPLTYDYELVEQPLDFLPTPTPSTRVSSSGGTLGHRKLIMRTSEDIVRSNKCTVKMFECAGILPGDRVAILQPFDLWNIGHLALMALEDIGATTCPLGLSASNETVLWILSELKCEVLYTSPSRAMQLADLCRKDKNKVSLKKVLCAGEPILQHHRETCLEVWGASVFGIYGSEETDGIGAECSFHTGYHVFNDDLILEVLDPTSLQPGSDELGALAITLLDYSGTALIRYVLGDLVKIHRNECDCGRKEPRVAMQGRIRDTVWLFDGNKLPLASIDASLSKLQGVSLEYQLVIDRKEDVDILEFNFIGSELPIDRDVFINAIVQTSQEMEVAFRYSRSLDVKIQVHQDRQALYTTQRGKTPRIVDRRSRTGAHKKDVGNESR